jgi:hypothetical protein
MPKTPNTVVSTRTTPGRRLSHLFATHQAKKEGKRKEGKEGEDKGNKIATLP